MEYEVVKILTGVMTMKKEKNLFGVLLEQYVEIEQHFVLVNILGMVQVLVHLKLNMLKKMG